MVMTKTSAPAARYIGITDECVVCQHCGKADLRATVVLEILGDDGTGEGITYYGSTCAARALGAGDGASVRRAASAATVATLRAAREAHRDLRELHARFAHVDESGALVWTRPAVVRAAAEGSATAVERVASIRRMAEAVADAAAIGYPTEGAVAGALRSGGWL